MKKNRNISPVIPLEQIFDPFNDTQLWYYIPGFNGYEISDRGILRSMKHYKKHPFGMILQGRVNKDDDIVFTLSNNHNKRVSITRSRLMELAKTNDIPVSSYPRRTFETDVSSRNQRIFIPQEEQVVIPEKTFYPTFSVVPDNDGMKKPIYFTK